MWPLGNGEDKYETHPIKLQNLLYQLDQLVVPFGNVESLQNVVPPLVMKDNYAWQTQTILPLFSASLLIQGGFLTGLPLKT